jgi:D-3-phosphoglycerate dehydrogenase
MTKSILIGPSSFAEISEEPLRMIIEAGYDVLKNPYGRMLEKNELIKLLNPDVIGLLSGLELIDNEVLSNSNIKVISRVGSGTSNVCKEALSKNNVKLLSVPDGPTQSVAELTVGNIINLLRKVVTSNTLLKNKQWKRNIGNELQNKTVAIIGFGRIGIKVAQCLSIFGANIIFYDNQVVDTNEVKARKVSFKEAISKSDIITIHYSGEEMLFSEKEFNSMKKGVILCNASRGHAIDEKALSKAIQNKIISGAWLDTFSEEPYKGGLVEFDEIIMTPHIGSYTVECRTDMELKAVKNLLSNL